MRFAICMMIMRGCSINADQFAANDGKSVIYCTCRLLYKEFDDYYQFDERLIRRSAFPTRYLMPPWHVDGVERHCADGPLKLIMAYPYVLLFYFVIYLSHCFILKLRNSNNLMKRSLIAITHATSTFRQTKDGGQERDFNIHVRPHSGLHSSSHGELSSDIESRLSLFTSTFQLISFGDDVSWEIR